ncbi:MAG: putative HicB family RNase H-like nuclease [Alloalcanivorax sp.]|jgi:predicted HicB family RNase H-like nuclease
MTILLQHRGYYGYVEVSQKNNCLHGALLNIEVPVHYQADTAIGLIRAFQDAVDNYLDYPFPSRPRRKQPKVKESGARSCLLPFG